MRRTTVYLPDDLKDGLERLATQLHRSEAELMREAVGNLLASLRPARQPLGPIFDIPETLGSRGRVAGGRVRSGLILADTSGLIALLNAGDSQHRELIAAVDNERDDFVVSPFVLAELDYLVVSHWGGGPRIGHAHRNS